MELFTGSTTTPTTTEKPINPITTILDPIEIAYGVYDLPVMIENFNSIGAISLTLNFIPEFIEYISVDINPILSGALSNVIDDRQLRIGWYGDEVSLSDKEILFTMRFRVLPTTAETTYFKWSTTSGNCEYASYGGEIIYDSTFIDLYWGLPTITTTSTPTTTIEPVPSCTRVINPQNGSNGVGTPLCGTTFVTLKWVKAPSAL